MKKIRIGLDFDGVVAYNPLRIVRSPIKFFKKEVLKINKLTFFSPKNRVEKMLWILIHETSILPADGVVLLKLLAKNKNLEFHLVTGRYGILKANLYKWLKKHDLLDVFKSIQVNENQEQPHIFKNRVLSKNQIKYYVEDNFDIVEFLTKNNKKIRTMWIYNILDRRYGYPEKFPALRGALEKIIRDENLT